MNYIEITVSVSDIAIQQALVALLANIDFEGFEEDEGWIKALIQEEKFNQSNVDIIVQQFMLTYSKSIIKHQNWNTLWESNFEPVMVADFVAIRAHFHDPIPNVKHELVITPKMSFGTGHHATTFLVMKMMEHVNFQDKSVFDFGTGTGILAILAEKLGAREVLAVDNDPWCIENAIENVINNFCQHIEIKQVNNANFIKKHDVVIANINKNIILDNLEFLIKIANANGDIILSGLLQQDEIDILNAFNQVGWKHTITEEKDGWIVMHFRN